MSMSYSLFFIPALFVAPSSLHGHSLSRRFTPCFSERTQFSIFWWTKEGRHIASLVIPSRFLVLQYPYSYISSLYGKVNIYILWHYILSVHRVQVCSEFHTITRANLISFQCVPSVGVRDVITSTGRFLPAQPQVEPVGHVAEKDGGCSNVTGTPSFRYELDAGAVLAPCSCGLRGGGVGYDLVRYAVVHEDL